MMKSISSICILLFLIPVLSMAQAGEKGSVVDLDLDSLRWKNRVLIILSPTESDLSFQLQKQELASSFEGVLERDLMILELLEHGESRAENMFLSEKAVEDIRGRLGVRSGPFHVYLIGKDGTVKLRSAEPVMVLYPFRACAL